MSMDQKGIATADLLFATLIAIVIFASLISSVSNEMNKTQTGDLGQARMIGERLASSINTVFINGNGYTMNTTLPNNINYNLNVNNSGLFVIFNGKKVKINLIPKANISSVNMTQGQKYIIKNNNGTITFTSI
ncbi:MAG: hypothetical protein Q8R66_05410 [Methanobacteriaceae archaeon]|nr:hypothetical protein [Methanobacteriaceae archaeon]